MNKVILRTEDVEFLLKWRDMNTDIVRMTPLPMKSCQMRFPDTGFVINAKANEQTIRFDVILGPTPLGRLEFERNQFGLCKLKKNKTKLKSEDIQAVLTVYASLMALFVYGNETVKLPEITDEKKKSRTAHEKARKKVHTDNTTYILTRDGNEPHVDIKGSHRSPSCTFSVRGHYRHYKNGRVIWIEEFTKGNGKRKEKTYKVGLKGE